MTTTISSSFTPPSPSKPTSQPTNRQQQQAITTTQSNTTMMKDEEHWDKGTASKPKKSGFIQVLEDKSQDFARTFKSQFSSFQRPKKSLKQHSQAKKSLPEQ